MRSRPADEEGVAALEFVLFGGLLFAVLAILAPLALALYQKVQLERAAGTVIRFATVQTGPTEAPAPDHRDVQSEAGTVYSGPGSVTADSLSLTTDTGCPRGTRVTVTLRTTASLGPFGFVYRLINTSPPSGLPLSATASSCQE